MKLLVPRENVEQPPMISCEYELNVAIASLSIGGAERIVLDWAARIYPQWRVHLVVLHDREIEWPVPPFVKVTRLRGSQLVEQLRLLGRIVAVSGNPVCVCHLLKKRERDALAESGVHVVTVLHNARDGWIEAASSLSGSSLTVAVSRACAWDLRESGWQGPVSVIRHIPPKRKPVAGAREHFRKSWNVPPGATVIGMIGAVKPQKNYPFALRILKAFLQKQDAYLVIVGGPVNKHNGRPSWERLVDEVYRLGLRKRVSMPGFIPDAAACLPAFDVMLNTSHYEGLSIATLEELIHGLPVVAARVGGQGEIAGDGLLLLDKGASEDDWVAALQRGLNMKPDAPSWTNFPAYRQWTLAGIARPVKHSDKVLFITANLNSGGAQRSLVNLTKALRGQMPFGIAVTGRSSTAYFYHDLKRSGFDVTSTGEPWNAFTYAEKLVQKICAEGFGTVCFWNVDARIKLLIVKALGFTDLRFVDVSPGNYTYDEMSNASEFQQLVTFTQEDYFNRLDALVLKYNGSYPKECRETVQVIRNGVPRPEKVKTDYAIHGKARIVVNGRIAPTKFLKEIIQAMHHVWTKLPGTELHIYGGAEHYHQEYAEELFGLAEHEAGRRIIFHGVDFEVISHLPDYDAYIVLGKNQGCPNALLEAMAVGLPVMGNDDGGTREQIRHDETGLLLPDCYPAPLAEAITKILTNRALAEELGRAGREHIQHHFSMQQMTESYLQLFRKLSSASEARHGADRPIDFPIPAKNNTTQQPADRRRVSGLISAV
ncbi:MAG: glycosyltransferase family 4 protein [Syntrophobacteraceae bacterium]